MNGIDEVARNDHRPLRLDGLHVLVAYAHGADASGQHEIVEVKRLIPLIGTIYPDGK